MKTHELHYPMILFLITTNILNILWDLSWIIFTNGGIRDTKSELWTQWSVFESCPLSVLWCVLCSWATYVISLSNLGVILCQTLFSFSSSGESKLHIVLPAPVTYQVLHVDKVILLPPFSLILDFGKQNTCGNISKISVSLACYQKIRSKSRGCNMQVAGYISIVHSRMYVQALNVFHPLCYMNRQIFYWGFCISYLVF